MIARAAADIALKLVADRLFREGGAQPVHHIDSGHDHARRAEPALQAVMRAESCLHRVQIGPVREALDGGDVRAVAGHGEGGAGFDGLAIHMHHTGAALARITADMGAGEADRIAQKLHQQGAGIDLSAHALAVHNKAHLWHGNFSMTHTPPGINGLKRTITFPHQDFDRLFSAVFPDFSQSGPILIQWSSRL